MTAAVDSPRPYGVERAESLRLVEAFEITEPTLAEALSMDAMFDGDGIATALGACTVPQLVVSAACAQRALHAEGQRPYVNRGLFAYYWCTMRAAQLVLACRSTQKLGGPIYA